MEYWSETFQYSNYLPFVTFAALDLVLKLRGNPLSNSG